MLWWMYWQSLQTLNNSVRGRANVSSTSLISDQSSFDLNSWRYLEDNSEEQKRFYIFFLKLIRKKHFKSLRSEFYLLKRECAVRSTPLMMWKSPLLKRVTISVSRSGHFWGKSSLPMILMASLNCGNAQDKEELGWASSITPSNQTL